MYKFRITDKQGKFQGYQNANNALHALELAKINGIENSYWAEMEGFNW